MICQESDNVLYDRRMRRNRSEDRHWMERALALAARAGGETRPNPMVGAVVVHRGCMVGEGFHARAGGPHAEIVALTAAGSRARDAVLYVTLEPCGHYGRTPPCTEAIIGAGVRRVVYALRDPHRAVAGEGLARLKAAGLAVLGPLLPDAARRLNRPYLHWRETGRPYVIVKVGATLDGKVVDRGGHSEWITNPEVRSYVHQWRRRVDAILIGRQTLVRDDPRLTVRLPGYRGPQPQPILWIGGGPVPWRARLLSRRSGSLCLVDCHRPGITERLSRMGHEVMVVRSVAHLLRRLGARDISTLMVEGGPQTIGHFLRTGYVDYCLIGMAPILLGGTARGWTDGKGWKLTMAPKIHVEKIERFGDNIVIEGPYVQRHH